MCREGVQIVERLKFEGRHLLDRIARCCDKIDSYTSRIDQGYNALERLRAKIFDTMGLDKNDRITSGLKKTFAGDMVREFFQLLGNIHSLKKARRACYRKISGIKKAWFGFLSNKEVELAEKYGAVIVRENMTAEAIEKDDPEYRGCLFNKMMNNGSKGIYQRSASEKLSWNGIPELLIASWYTSRSCTVHSKVIDKKHRQGESIYLPCCGQHDHADLHAWDTIASYLFLQPRITAGDSVTSGS